ncbi:hypothetical protein GCM10009080_46290 [Cupriavidus pauculus]
MGLLLLQGRQPRFDLGGIQRRIGHFDLRCRTMREADASQIEAMTRYFTGLVEQGLPGLYRPQLNIVPGGLCAHGKQDATTRIG